MSSFSLKFVCIFLIAAVQAVWIAQGQAQVKTEALTTMNPTDTLKSQQQVTPTTNNIAPMISTTTSKPRVTSLLSNYKSNDDSMSMVSVDKNPNTGASNKVDVHIPFVFDMTNDKNNAKLDLSVLSGFVTVSRDKARQPNGAISGPLTVSIFGIPIYSGQSAPSKLPQSSSSAKAMAVAKEDNGVSTRFNRNIKSDSLTSTGADDIDTLLPEPTNPLYMNMKKMNDKFLSFVGDSLNKIALTVGQKAEPISHKSGKPATKSDGFVAQSKFLKADFEPKLSLKNYTSIGDLNSH